VKNPERWGRIFVVTVTTVVMTVLGLWLQWVRETQRWDYFAIYCAVLVIIMWRLKDYREPPL
jgi:bacteriorhodopsin